MCDHAQILDLRYVVYSNLGCQGPNVTYVYTDPNTQQVHEIRLPCEILYWNVLRDENQDPNIDGNDIVYMHLRNTSEYQSYDTEMNAVTREPEEACVERGGSNCKDNRAWGAYGQVNMKTGTATNFEVFFTKNHMKGMEVTYLDKVFQLQFLDIDQGRNAMDVSEVGGETLKTCTGANSFAYPAENGRISTELKHSEEVMPDGQVCHVVQSTQFGNSSDNVWDPAGKEGEYVGLSKADKDKTFLVATYGQNLSWSYEVKEGGVNEGFGGRNFVFASHASSFCQQDFADKVKADA